MLIKASDPRRLIMLKALKPYMLSIFCSCCYAGLNIISKVSLDKGMSRYVLVVYAHAFATLATAVLAILFERFFILTPLLILQHLFICFYTHLVLQEKQK